MSRYVYDPEIWVMQKDLYDRCLMKARESNVFGELTDEQIQNCFQVFRAVLKELIDSRYKKDVFSLITMLTYGLDKIDSSVDNLNHLTATFYKEHAVSDENALRA